MIKNLTNGIYKLCEWITRLVYLNLLWIGFSLLGLIIVGFFPATIAMFTVTRKWMMGETDVNIFRLFLGTFKSEILKANMLGYILVGFAILLYFDYQIAMVMEQNVFLFIFTLLSLVFAFLVIMIFPVYVHYDIPLKQTFKYALLLSFVRPLNTFAIILAVIGVTFVVLLHTLSIIFFSGSLLSLVITALSIRTFNSLNKNAADEKKVTSI